MEKKQKHQDEVPSHMIACDWKTVVSAGIKRHKRTLLMLSALCVVAIAGLFGLDAYKVRMVEEMQEDYRQAQKEGEMLTFAERYAKEPLAGSVFLQEADRLFNEDQYAQALNFYKKAQKALQTTPFAGRSAMGVAFCQILGDDSTTGVQGLRLIAKNGYYEDTIRAQAAYNLALYYLVKGEKTEAEAMLAAVNALPNAAFWGHKAQALQQLQL